MHKVVFLAYGGAEATVFDSQVLVPIRILRTQGADIQLALFQNWRDYFLRRTSLLKKSAAAQEAAGAAPAVFPRVPRNWGGFNTRRLKQYFGSFQEPLIVHARGVQSAALALQAKGERRNIKVILDHRGLEAEEYLYIVEKEKGREPGRGDRNWYHRLLDLEKIALQGADRVFCVSNALKRALVSRYGSGEKIQVIPCGVDTELFGYDAQRRRQTRKFLGLEHRLILAYAGSLRAWQEASILPKVLAAAKRAVPSSYLLIITPQKEAATRALAGTPQSDYCVLDLPHAQVPPYLEASDIGVLTRPSHIVNQVASPTKGPEYLASGNLVLTTPHPEDLAGIVTKEGVGAVVSGPDDEEGLISAVRSLKDQIEKEGEAARLKARQTAENYYAWPRHIPKILEAYRELA